jgi:hypothetical protein
MRWLKVAKNLLQVLPLRMTPFSFGSLKSRCFFSTMIAG